MKVLYSLVLSLVCVSAISQTVNKQWAWVSGSNQLNQPPIYGTKGVADPNSFPGSRISPASWTTPDGKLWLFGGTTVDGSGSNFLLNDLWMYDPATNMWTWKHGPSISEPSTSHPGTVGVPDPANLPEARVYSSTWADKAGNLWMYGGQRGNGIFFLADLWKFDPSTNQWTWISGTMNTFDEGEPGVRPGNRTGASAAVDADGNFWLVGGLFHTLFTQDIDVTTRSVWKYNPVSQSWTFYVGGDPVNDIFNNPSNFGTKGVPNAENAPPTRYDASLWVDSLGHLFWFGGTEYFLIGAGSDDPRFDAALRNDLWRFDTVTKIWTWMNGSKDRNPYGHYGNLGIPDSANTPGGRGVAVTFSSLNGKMMLFGGSGRSQDSIGFLNDLWNYDAASNEWTWMDGSNNVNQPGLYGDKGVADSMNIPGARGSAAGFADAAGNLWLYGGGGYVSDSGSINPAGALSDLWKLGTVEDSAEVVFKSFTAKDKRAYVQLNWKIAKDQHTDYIVVEHSTDGNNFERLGRVKPSRYSSSRSYTYVHALPGKGDHYYRLQHFNTEVESAYSWVEKVFVDNPHTLPHDFNISFLLFPNPVTNWLYMTVQSGEEANVQLVLYNNNGQPVIQQKQTLHAGFNSVKLNVANYKPGMYTVVVLVNGKKFSQRMIKL